MEEFTKPGWLWSWFSIIAVCCHSFPVNETNNESGLLLFWTFGISATRSQSLLDLLQPISSSFTLLIITVWKCLGIYIHTERQKERFLCKVWNQYVKNKTKHNTRSVCCVWRTWHLEGIVLHYSLRETCLVVLLFCQPFSDISIYLLSREKAWEASIPDKVLLSSPRSRALASEYISHYSSEMSIPRSFFSKWSC